MINGAAGGARPSFLGAWDGVKTELSPLSAPSRGTFHLGSGGLTVRELIVSQQ